MCWWCKYIEKAGQRAFIALSSASGDGVYPFHLVLNHAPLRSSVVRFRSTLAAGGACRQEGLRGLHFGRSGRSCGAIPDWRLSGRGFLPGSGAEGRWRWADVRERPPGSAGGCGMGAARPRRQMLRAERSGARTTEGAGWKWRAPGGRFGEGMVGICFLLLIDAVPVAAWVHFCRRVSAANTAGYGWEANWCPFTVRRVGIRIMSGANTAEYWSVKSLWPEWSVSGMEDDNLLAEVNTRSVIRVERSLRSGKRMTGASVLSKGPFSNSCLQFAYRNHIHFNQNQRITNVIREFCTLIQDVKVKIGSVVNPGIE